MIQLMCHFSINIIVNRDIVAVIIISVARFPPSAEVAIKADVISTYVCVGTEQSVIRNRSSRIIPFVP